MNNRSLRVFFLVFIASGFAGLIYESIWTHYLKLFLGHAAYAQALVLAVFMGGMAIGLLICSKYSERISNLLIGYAVVEVVIGICAVLFHPLYVQFIDAAYARFIPGLSSPLGSSDLQMDCCKSFDLTPVYSARHDVSTHDSGSSAEISSVLLAPLSRCSTLLIVSARRSAYWQAGFFSLDGSDCQDTRHCRLH